MEDPNKDTIISALKATQQLRTSVSLLFTDLKDGIKNTGDQEDKPKAFLSCVQQNLLDVNSHFSDLEKHAGTMGSSVSSSHGTTLGNVGVLSLDPVVDKQLLFPQLMAAYSWSNKMHEHAQQAASFLQGNLMKRSNSWVLLGAKRQKKPQTNSHAVAAKNVDALMQNLERLFPTMTISLTRPIGNPAVLQITLGKVMKVLVVLRGLIVEWVNAKAFNEEFTTENGKLDVWDKSKHMVFQKVSDHTKAAMLHFYYPIAPEIAVKSFLTWLQSYSTLFSHPCTKCGRFLQENLPPTWRDFFTLQPYHESCKP